MQDMEFTVEERHLYMLQTRTGSAPRGHLPDGRGHGERGLIKLEEALERIKDEDIERLFYPIIDPARRERNLQSAKSRKELTPFRAPPSAKPCSPQHDAEEWAAKGKKVILVRRETSPEDVGGMSVAREFLPPPAENEPRRRGRSRLGQVLRRRRGEIRY